MKTGLGLVLCMSFLPTLALSCASESEPEKHAAEITVQGKLHRADRAAFAEAGGAIGPYLGSGQYRVLLPDDVTPDCAISVFGFIAEIAPIDPATILDPALREGRIPDHARLENGLVRLWVHAYEGALDAAASVLKGKAYSVALDDMSEALIVELPESSIADLAAVPEVSAILPPPEPGAL